MQLVLEREVVVKPAANEGKEREMVLNCQSLVSGVLMNRALTVVLEDGRPLLVWKTWMLVVVGKREGCCC